jgi:hypothetical protein
MKNFLKIFFIPILFISTLLFSLSACISNDLPYPKISQNILSIAAVGQLSPATIDSTNYQVTLYLDETTDISKVSFSDFTYTPGATPSANLLEGEYDLSSPMRITLSGYQNYQWLISAEQTISKKFSISGQIGETVLDDVGHRIIVKVPESANLSKLTLNEIKLGPTGLTTIVPDMQPGIVDFSSPKDITVSYFDKVEYWTIYVQKTSSIVTTTQVDAWAQVIWATGNAPESADNGFQYRESSSSEWIDVSKSDITFSGGSFVARIVHLKPNTEYVVRAISDDNIGNEVTVITEGTANIENGSFDNWWLDGKVWCPWSETGSSYWDTGNTGACTLGQSNVQPSDYTPAGVTGQSAMLETRFVGIGPVGKLAAGSIYTGRFDQVDGTNGILDFGRPFNLHPTKLKGYYQYTTAPINYASTEYQHLLNRPDSCHIYIALTDWTAPYKIRTNPKNRQLFDKNSSSVIAYGELICGTSMSGYKEFEIELNYRDTSRIPSYIQITCAASKYGDFFTGGSGAILYVDQFSFSFDY